MLLHLFLSLHLILSLSTIPSSPAAAAASNSLPGCPDRCGNVTVPYPFGTSPGCHRPGFRLTCNDTHVPPALFVNCTNIIVSEITPDELSVESWVARDCYKPLRLDPGFNQTYIDVTGTPYTFSYTRNKFTVLGCDSLVISYRGNVKEYASGCVSLCSNTSNIANGTCSGIGCCQTAIPKETKRLDTVVRSVLNHNTTWNISPCSYAFVVDQEMFAFKVADLYDFERRTVPVVLD